MMNSRHVYEANLPMKISYSRIFYSLNYSCVFKAPLIKVNNDFKDFLSFPWMQKSISTVYLMQGLHAGVKPFLPAFEFVTTTSSDRYS